MPLSPNTYDLELSSPSGTTLVNGETLNLALMLAPPTDEGAPRTLDAQLQAVASDETIEAAPRTRAWTNQGRGIGLDYDIAPGCYTRTAGYVCPAGLAVTATLAAGSQATEIVAFAEYKGDLYYATRGSATQEGRVFRMVGGTGAPAGIPTQPALAAGQYIKDMLVADDGIGGQALFVSSSDTAVGNGFNGRLHKTYNATAWTSSPLAGAGSFAAAGLSINRLASVYWMTADGNGAWRLVTVETDTFVAYTLPNADPINPANWTPLRIGTSGKLVQPVAFRKHVYFGATDDLYDVNDQGESQQMTRYLKVMLQPGNADAIEVLHSYIYIGVGRGLIRTYVGDGQYDESPIEGQCAPGWGMPGDANKRGRVTAMTVDQGYLVVAVFDQSTHSSGIYWGVDRRIVGIDSRNPLIWYGPEITLKANLRVSKLWSSGLGSDGILRLWIASIDDSSGVSRLDYVYLPVAGSPLQDISAGGTHRFCTDAESFPPSGVTVQAYSRIESLQDPGPDEADLDILLQHDITARGPLNTTDTLIYLDTRSDPDPVPDPPANWHQVTASAVTISPMQSLVPTVVVSGHTTQWRARLVALHGLNSPPQIPILRTVRTLVSERVNASRTIRFRVQYGDGAPGPRDVTVSPDEKTRVLKLATESGKLNLRTRNDTRYSVLLRQTLDTSEEWFDGTVWGKRVTTTLEVQILGAAT